MSTLAAWSYVEGPLTVWPILDVDERGQPIYGVPYTIPQVDYELGGEVQRDENGDEFTPNITVYFEAPEGSTLPPKRDWYMKLGDHTGEVTPPTDAERVRTLMKWPMTKFGGTEIPDWKVVA